MSLINCSECQMEISDRAASCPKCGCPVAPLASAPPPAVVGKPKRLWSPLWAFPVAVVLQYAGCEMLKGAMYSLPPSCPDP